jgi:hypothetical protein
VYELREDGPPLKGRINLQVGTKNQFALVELEMIGIEEVRWSQGKLQNRGNYVFLKEKVAIHTFLEPPESLTG